jgi:hypothetical protein
MFVLQSWEVLALGSVLATHGGVITASVVHLNWNIAHRLHRITDVFRRC